MVALYNHLHVHMQLHIIHAVASPVNHALVVLIKALCLHVGFNGVRFFYTVSLYNNFIYM